MKSLKEGIKERGCPNRPSQDFCNIPFLENQIGHQLQHSGSAGNAEERKIPPAWVTAGFFKR